MLCEVESFNVGAFRASGAPEQALALSRAIASTTVESIEQEITRLTWAVLDGSAALVDRQRLAELVRHQHDMRRRLNA